VLDIGAKEQIAKQVFENYFSDLDEIVLSAMAAGVPACRIVLREPLLQFDVEGISIESFYGFVPEQAREEG
jgi:hypothetical protein